MSNISDTGQGILVGAEPAQPRMANDYQQTRPDQAVSQPIPQRQQPPQEDRPAYRWTDDDIENARKQEKDKLYPRIDEMQNQLRELAEAREAERAERDRLAQEAADAQRAKEESELNVRELLEKREREAAERMAALESRYNADREVFAKERMLQEAELYRRDRIAQESNDILPELRDFIQGSTPEEIDQSIEAMKERTASVLANFAAVEPQPIPYQQRMGASPTAPPVGPMEQLPSYESLTPEDIRGMDMDTYKKYRNQLLQATSQAQRRG